MLRGSHSLALVAVAALSLARVRSPHFAHPLRFPAWPASFDWPSIKRAHGRRSCAKAQSSRRPHSRRSSPPPPHPQPTEEQRDDRAVPGALTRVSLFSAALGSIELSVAGRPLTHPRPPPTLTALRLAAPCRCLSLIIMSHPLASLLYAYRQLPLPLLLASAALRPSAPESDAAHSTLLDPPPFVCAELQETTAALPTYSSLVVVSSSTQHIEIDHIHVSIPSYARARSP